MESYHGTPYADLRIDAVDWTHRAEHLRTRSERHRNDVDLEPEWATEAALDRRRVLGDGRSRSGNSIQVIGWSASAGRLLAVVLVERELAAGVWWGATAWAANDKEARRYADAQDG